MDLQDDCPTPLRSSYYSSTARNTPTRWSSRTPVEEYPEVRVGYEKEVEGKAPSAAAGGAQVDLCNSPPPFQASFWSRDPTTSEKRNTFFGIIFRGLLCVILVIFCVLSIYWGSLWKTNELVYNIHGWVVDFDGGPIGASVRAAFLNITGPVNELTWTVISPSQFPGGSQDVANAVIDESIWVAVVVNQGASNNLSAAIAGADGSYNGTQAITAFTNPGRSNYAQTFYMTSIQKGIRIASTIFRVQNALQVASNTTIDLQTLLSNAPSTVTNPLDVTMVPLRPFDVSLAVAIQSVGLIYLLIISFIVSMINYQARVIVSQLNRHLKLRSLLFLRMFTPIFCYFFVSFFYSLLSLAFQAPLGRVFGKSGFLIFWMMSYCGMLALGLAMEAMITLLTPSFIPYFLFLWIIVNVSVATLPVELLPRAFKYGYAFPFYNFAEAARTILFNTRNRLGMNFGVQIAWFCLSLFTMLVFTVILRVLERRKWEQAQRQNSSMPEVVA